MSIAIYCCRITVNFNLLQLGSYFAFYATLYWLYFGKGPFLLVMITVLSFKRNEVS